MVTRSRADGPKAHRQAAAIAITAGAILIWRVVTTPVFDPIDAWGYRALGRDLIDGYRLRYDLTGAGKPLSTLLGALASPLSTQHAFQVVIAVVLAGLLALVYFTARQRAGAVAGAVAVAALVSTPGFRRAFFSATIDSVTALLVIAAIAARGWLRVACLVAAGLLRPEAWLVAGVVAGAQASGGRIRKLAVGAAVAALAPTIWLCFDAIFAGGPRRSGPGGLSETVVSAAYEVAKSLGVEGGVIIAAIGLAALAARLIRERGHWSQDELLVVLMVTVWPAILAAMYAADVAVPTDRYVFPIVAVLAVEIGLLVGWAGGYASGWQSKLAPVACIAWVALVVFTTSPSIGDRVVSRDYVRIVRSLPALEEVLSCGRLGVVGQQRVGDPAANRSLRGFVPQLAIATDRPLAHFSLERRASHAGILNVYGSARNLPSWPTRYVPIGEVLVSPRCAH